MADSAALALTEASRFRAVGLPATDNRQDYLLLNATTGEALRFPVGPERYDDETGMETIEHRVDALGPVVYPRGQTPYRVSWQGWLFGESRRDEPFIADWQAPDEIIRLLDRWLRGDGQNGSLLYLTISDSPVANFPCYLLRFKYNPVGGYGDYQYEVEFTWARQVRLLTEAELQALLAGATPGDSPALAAEAAQAGAAEAPPADVPGSAELLTDTLLEGPDDPVPATYTVQAGDSLWEIARRTYGDGTVWRAVYAANEAAIGSDPNRIYPGLVLSLPPS